MNKNLIKKIKNIKMFLMDVDGVLTDGKMFYFKDSNGRDHEFKAFNSHDGIGIIVLNKFGIKTGIITGRESESIFERAKTLKMDYIYQGFITKMWAFREILKKSGIKKEEICYMGDDLPDIPVMKEVGFAVAPSNAVPEVKKYAHYVTRKEGGNGAVREVCELIIKYQGLEKKMFEGFVNGKWPKSLDNKKIINILYSRWKSNR